MGKRTIIISGSLLAIGLGYFLYPLITIENLSMVAIVAGIVGITVGTILSQSNSPKEQE